MSMFSLWGQMLTTTGDGQSWQWKTYICINIIISSIICSSHYQPVTVGILIEALIYTYIKLTCRNMGFSVNTDYRLVHENDLFSSIQHFGFFLGFSSFKISTDWLGVSVYRNEKHNQLVDCTESHTLKYRM